MRMKQKTKSIVTALLLGVLCAVTLSAVITVPDWETARADLLIGMQYETTGLDLDAVPGWLAALVMLHQNFPLDGWAWGPAAAGLAVLLCWVRGQREAKPKRTELVLSIVFGIAEVLGLSICKLGSWAFVFKNPYQLCVGVLCMAGYAVLFYHAVWGLYALLGRSRTGGEDFPQTRFAAWFAKAPGRASSLLIGAAWLPWVAVFWPGSVDWDSWGQISQVLGVQEMTAHHTVLSTWLHGWLFRLGRALGSDNLGVFLYIVLQFLVCAWVFGQVTAFCRQARLLPRCAVCGHSVLCARPHLGRVHPDAGQGYALHGTVRPVRAENRRPAALSAGMAGKPPASDRLRGARRALLPAAQKSASMPLCRCCWRRPSP